MVESAGYDGDWTLRYLAQQRRGAGAVDAAHCGPDTSVTLYPQGVYPRPRLPDRSVMRVPDRVRV
jgi:hypothetical protein